MAAVKPDPSLLSGLAPLLGDQPRILVLGSFPSPLSREKQEYYGNPKNSFWRILFACYGEDFSDPDAETKRSLIERHHIAIWDVIAECQAKNAADTSIKNQSYNLAILDLITATPSMKKLFFNGNAAYRFFIKGLGEPPLPYSILPSTSPAYARLSFEQKSEIWKAALQCGEQIEV